MSELERHGLQYRIAELYAGVPWEDDCGRMVVYAPVAKWPEADLTADQMAEVEALVEKQMTPDRTPADRMWLHWATLNWLGVEHTHRMGEPIDRLRPARGYVCSMCRSWVVNEDPGDYPFVGGPADGWWIVTGGAMFYRVPIVKPLSVADFTLEATPQSHAVDVAEYQRRGGRYVFIE